MKTTRRLANRQRESEARSSKLGAEPLEKIGARMRERAAQLAS
jgi:hypothetical protein